MPGGPAIGPNLDALAEWLRTHGEMGGPSWLDQAIGGIPQLASDTWSGINDLGERWFGGGPGDFSGQMETARQYAEDTADQYVNMARHPVGYARDNPSATLVGLAGLAAGGGGAALRGLSHVGKMGSNYMPHHAPDAPDAPSVTHGITSRLTNAEEAAAQADFARMLATMDPRGSGTGRIKGTDPRLGPAVDRIGRGTLDRLIHEERGGTADPSAWPRGKWAEGEMKGDPSVQTDIWNEVIDNYVKRRQPEAGDLDAMSPEGRAIHDVLTDTSLGGPRQPPTMGPRAALDLERAIAARARTRRLMEGEGGSEHRTRMGAQSGADMRAGGTAGTKLTGGESQQWAPYDSLRLAREERLSRKGPRKSKPNPNVNPDVNVIPDPRVREGEGAASGGPAEPGGNVAEGYSGGIRDVLANEARRPTLDDLYEHETDIGNIESIRQKGIEARWDPAEEGRKLVSARRRNPKGGDPSEGRARVIFRTSQSPMEREGLTAVKFREGIRPEDIVDIVQAKKSTLAKLAEDVHREGRDLDPDFETKPRPSPSPPRKSKAPKKVPPRPMPKNTSGPTPAEMAARAHQQM